ncbi:LOW QUALITY PROTEIN: cytosolic phospholipase A2 gamma-like [Aplochiton taeniatus]
MWTPVFQKPSVWHSATVLTEMWCVNTALGVKVRAGEGSVRKSHSLSAGEQEFIVKRKQKVHEALKRLGIDCQLEDVPHIALLASGGGQRAAVSLLGTLHQMGEDDLLDTLLYLAGVSGSTWSMSSLYRDPGWGANVSRVVSTLKGPGVGLEEAMGWLNQRVEDHNFCLTHVWGIVTAAGIMKEIDTRCLSNESDREATNPYPVYCAIEKDCFTDGTIQGEWFEATPHEVGFTELGLFIDTAYMDSSYHQGVLQNKSPEIDMVHLQGILGCALADEETLKGLMPDWMKATGDVDGSSGQYLQIYLILIKLVDLMKSRAVQPSSLVHINQLETLLQQQMSRNSLEQLGSKSPEEKKLFIMCFFFYSVSWVVKHIFPLLVKWEWGTTRNFHHNYKEAGVPPCLWSSETLHLIDAGLAINAPYPPLLGDKRDIDLMIAPEYSAGNMFEVGYSVVEERDYPRDLYVFEGERDRKEPTVVYMPLFNTCNCQDAEEVKREMAEYATFQLPFSPEKIDYLVGKAKDNMKRNKDTLIKEIKKAVLLRQHKR